MDKISREDIEFFEEMYQETFKLVYYIISKIVLNTQTSEDLTQDTFESAFKNLGTLKGRDKESQKAWISVVASNKAKDYLRKKKPSLFTDIGGEEIEFEPEDNRLNIRPDQLSQKNELKRTVNEVMESLPEDQRLVVMMYYFQQLTTKEIAENLSLSENTVKSKVNYAKQKIKKAFNLQILNDYKLRVFSPIVLFQMGLRLDTYTVDIPPFRNIIGLQAVGTGNGKKERKNKSQNIVGKTLIGLGLAITIFTIVKPYKGTNDSSDAINNTSNIKERVDLFDYIKVEFSVKDEKITLSINILPSGSKEVDEALKKVRFEFQNELSNNSFVAIRIINFEGLGFPIKTNSKYYLVSGFEI